jgi:SAM-dependent methyltransferase
MGAGSRDQGGDGTRLETDPAVLTPAMLRRLPRRIGASGRLRLPAVPALVDEYLQRLAAIFAAVGRVFDEGEMAELRGILEPRLREGFEASPFAYVIVRYQTDDPPETTLSYTVSVQISTMNDEYAEWVESRTPPLFGGYADAKVQILARSLGPPAQAPVLDVGAGTGRNTLPLAREGFPTDAVELAPALAAVLRSEVERSGLPVRIFEGDALDPALDLPAAHYRLIVMAEVVASHLRSRAGLRAWFERVAALLAPGGLVVMSAFVAHEGYRPDLLALQLSQVFWCCLIAREDLNEASRGLPVELVSDESVLAFEREHLPKEAWPPTGWFVEWVSGLDLFDVSAGAAPFELRWLVYRKDSPGAI